MREPIRIADEEVLTSREAVDGVAFYAEAVYPGIRVHEITAGGYVITPSGREYRISELVWEPYGDRWKVSLTGAPA